MALDRINVSDTELLFGYRHTNYGHNELRLLVTHYLMKEYGDDFDDMSQILIVDDTISVQVISNECEEA